MENHVWMFKSEEERWEVFNKSDQIALDAGSEVDCVPVLGGRYDAFVSKRFIRSIYDVNPVELKIRRCVWFEEDTPFTETDSARISEWEKSPVGTLLLGDRKLYRTSNLQIFISGPSILSVSRHIRRFGEPDCAIKIPPSTGDDAKVPCKHLIITVHGIGEALWSKKAFNLKPFERNCAILRGLLSDHFQQQRIDVLPVTWFQILSESVYMKRMSDVTLTTIPMFRQIANGALSDVIFYLNRQHKDKIVAHVINRIKELVMIFKNRNPDFEGPISLIGHSLGSVICFDALSSENFPDDLRVSNLFLFGSPLGMFLTARDQVGGFPIARCKNIFNIIQPNDAVCYRIEPLIFPILKETEPAVIPNHKTGGLAAPTQLRKTASSIIELFSSDKDSTYFERLAHVVNGSPIPKAESPLAISLKSLEIMNNGSRMDWVVQQGFMPAGAEYADALTAHMSYFDNPDVAKFVYEKCN